MKILPTFIVTMFISIILVTFYLKSNNESTKYICIENETSNYLFITLEKKNFLSNLISSKHSSLKYEISLDESGFYNYSLKNGKELVIFKEKESLNRGKFSLVNNNLLLKVKNRFFKGKCSLYKDHCVNNLIH